MSIQIEDNGASIKVTQGAFVSLIQKSQINKIIHKSAGGLLRIASEGTPYDLQYEDIDVPTSTDIEDLANQIQAFLSTGGGVLPAGASTEAKQDAQITQLATLISNTTGLNLEVTQLLVKGVLDAIKVDTAKLDVLLSTRNEEATQLLIKSKTDNLDVALSTRASEVTVAAILTKLLASIVVTATDLDIRNLSQSQDSVLNYGYDGASPQPIKTAVDGTTKVQGDFLDGDAIATLVNLLRTASFSMLYNGATWDRMRGNIANGLDVDVTRSVLPTGAATETTLAAIKTELEAQDTFSANQSTTTVGASVTSVTLKVANTSRRQISIRNGSIKNLYVCFFTPATTATPFLLGKDEVWVFDKFTGDIYGIWDTGASDNAYITEETL